MNTNELVEMVRNYIDLGWSLIPILPDTKQPPIKWKKYQDERASFDLVMSWVNRGWYLALVTGDISAVMVIDDDRVKHGLPEWGFDSTVISESKSGGRHYYFQYDREVHSHSNSDIHVDLKAWHSYVLLPPFNERKWIKFPSTEAMLQLPSLSEEIITLINSDKKTDSDGNGEKLVIEDHLEVEEGGRTDALHELAMSLFNKLEKDVAMTLLRTANASYKPPLNEDEFNYQVSRAWDYVQQHPVDRGATIDLSTLEKKTVELQPVEKGDENMFEIECLRDLKNEAMPEEQWIIRDILPTEGIALIAGAPATGKSFYTLTMAQSITTNVPWLGKFKVDKFTNILFIDKENGRRRTQDRMRGLGMSGEYIYRIKQPHLFSFMDRKEKDGISKFSKEVVRFIDEKNIGLIVLDSLVDLMDGDENKSGDTQIFFDNIRYLFPNKAIIILHHEGKDSKNEKNKMDKTRGSSNIPGQVDISFRISRIKGKKSEFKFEHTKARDSEEMTPFTIKMAVSPDPKNSERTLVTGLHYGEDIVDDDPKEQVAEEIIKSMLPTKESGEILLMEDIYEECSKRDISQETAKNAISSLRYKGVLYNEKVGIKGYGNKHKFYKKEDKKAVVVTPYKDN